MTEFSISSVNLTLAEERQRYDSSVKALFKEEIDGIIDHLMPGAQILAILNTEVLRPTMRSDSAYRILHKEEEQIALIEIQSSKDKWIAYRTLYYAVSLLYDYHLPVRAYIIYLFEPQSAVPQSPLVVRGNNQDLLTFHYEVMELYKVDGRRYLRERIISMYPLVPAMANVTAADLHQVLDEMSNLYADHSDSFRRRLLWFRTILNRSTTITLEIRQNVEERMDIFQELLEQDDFVQKQRKLGEQLGEQRGEQSGRLQGARSTLLIFVEVRFPALATLAEQKITQITDLKQLQAATAHIATIVDEETAQSYLEGL